MSPIVVAAGIAGVSLILAACVYGVARLRIEQERTLQKLIDKGATGDELWRPGSPGGRGSRDLRRGVLLIAVGISWSAVTFFIGGSAWIAGLFPVTVGAAYVLFRILDGGLR